MDVYEQFYKLSRKGRSLQRLLFANVTLCKGGSLRMLQNKYLRTFFCIRIYETMKIFFLQVIMIQWKGCKKMTNEKFDPQIVLNSPFSIEIHKATFVNYLEVIILEDGTIEYATPSHQIKVTDIIAKRRNISRNDVADLCPREYYFNYSKWLCKEARAVMVWSNFYMGTPNENQLHTLKQLLVVGLYYGKIKTYENKK